MFGHFTPCMKGLNTSERLRFDILLRCFGICPTYFIFLPLQKVNFSKNFLLQVFKQFQNNAPLYVNTLERGRGPEMGFAYHGMKLFPLNQMASPMRKINQRSLRRQYFLQKKKKTFPLSNWLIIGYGVWKRHLTEMNTKLYVRKSHTGSRYKICS